MQVVTRQKYTAIFTNGVGIVIIDPAWKKEFDDFSDDDMKTKCWTDRSFQKNILQPKKMKDGTWEIGEVLDHSILEKQGIIPLLASASL